MRRSLVALCLVLGAATGSAAILPPGDYDPAIPTCASVWGAEVGEVIQPSSQIEKYARALDEASDRVTLVTDGRSYHGRPLFYLCVSDPANLKRFDEIVETTRRVRAGTGSFPPDQPVAVGIYAAVHGDEISSAEATLSLAYLLAASRTDQTAKLLKDLVVIIDPLQNPDGRERFLAHYEWMRNLQPAADQNAAEHSEFWPGGRGNGNLFDMNRDWFTLTQPETRTRIKRYYKLLPQVLVDLHEMGGDSTYFFPPPADPMNKNLSPEVIDLFHVFGRAMAGAFDSKGYAYFSGEVFDEFFPGYGSSWPLFLGTLGMTFEQASTTGLVYRRSTGDTFTFADAISRHLAASLTTCETAAAQRTHILDSYTRYCRRALTAPTGQGVRAFAIPPHANLHRLLTLLADQGIAAKQLTAPYSPRTARRLTDVDAARNLSLPAGTAIIPVAQPARDLLVAIMEGRPEIDRSFVEKELERKKHRLESEIYDITGWSLPICYNLKAYSLSEDLPGSLSDWSGVEPRGVIADATATAGGIYAYVIDYAQDAAVPVAASLLREGFTVHVAEKVLALAGTECSRGSYVLRTAGNPPRLKQRVDELAKAHSCSVLATPTGYTKESIDLGSMFVRRLRDPRIAVLTDSPISSTSYGAVRWMLESQYGLPFTALKTRDLEFLDLRPYRTIIIPNTMPMYLKRTLGKEGTERLMRWVESGGTLVAIKGAAAMLLEDEFELEGGRVLTLFKKDSAEPAPEPKKKGEGGEEEEQPEGDYEAPGQIPGTLYTVSLDTLDWLTSGYSDSVPVFVRGSLLIDWPESSDRCVGRYAKNPKLSGFSWDIDDRRIEGKAYLARVEQGDGQVILFADEPYFRGYMRGLDRLFLNAVFNAASYLESLDY